MGVFYIPKDGVCGDFIPFFNKKRQCYELYYLHDFREGSSPEERKICWRRITTTNMTDFREEGTILHCGTVCEQDLFCYTGCVVEHDGMYHIFYTGHNDYYPNENMAQEAVMHAVSRDGFTWTKQIQDTFTVPPECTDLERDDWRDPFVFYNEEKEEWWMLLCTRKKTGASRRRGATALLTSQNLIQWKYENSFWNPYMCWCPECPELFQWGKYWYLIYSTFTETEGYRTYYRISESLNGPWKNPGNNSFDGRAFYAGKTASDGKERYIFGWNPTKEGDRDDGNWQWGGHLVVHRLLQNPDGSLAVTVPEGVQRGYSREVFYTTETFYGNYRNPNQMHVLENQSGTACFVSRKIPFDCMITFEIMLETGTDSAELMVRADYEGNKGYYVRIEPGRGRLVYDREPFYQHEYAELQKFVNVAYEKWHSVKMILDDTCAIIYLDKQYALSARMYDYRENNLFFFVNDGKMRVRNLHIFMLNEVKGEQHEED